jgi:hypothetical protein
MTKAAQYFGKELKEFWKLNETKEYMCALVEVLFPNGWKDTDLNADEKHSVVLAINEFEKGQHSFITHKETRALKALLAEATKGHGGGTWAHPKLAVFFARWLDVRFAVWCDLMVDEILRGRVEVQPVATPLTPDRTVEDIVKALLPEVRRGVSFIPRNTPQERPLPNRGGKPSP